jgi:putative ABC transport system permease protein
MIDAFLQDLRYAFRGLRSKPGFTAAVIVTLGLGIGANAAMFGIIDRMLFRPPPMMIDPETAHRVYVTQTFRGTERTGTVSMFARFTPPPVSRSTTSRSASAKPHAR